MKHYRAVPRQRLLATALLLALAQPAFAQDAGQATPAQDQEKAEAKDLDTIVVRGIRGDDFLFLTHDHHAAPLVTRGEELAARHLPTMVDFS